MYKSKIIQLAEKSKQASQEICALSTNVKNKILKDVAKELIKEKTAIINANKKDVRTAKAKGLSAAMIDRLVLNEKRIKEMKEAVLDIVKLPDPVGDIIETRKRLGLNIKKTRIPLGVVCIIYESRPNVTIDAASLCFKSGNAVILRGGSEAFYSNALLVKIFSSVLKKHGINSNTVSLVPYTERKAMISLLQLDKLIDVVIPRGGESLMKFIGDHTRIPVIKHDKGTCSLFVDESADTGKAIRIIENAKIQRPGVCNALETLYVHRKIAKKILPELCDILGSKGVEIRGDDKAQKIVKKIKKAKEIDYSEEYLDLILAIKVVKDVHEAIGCVIKYSSDHTDGIITENKKNVALFVKSINSSCVTVNTSTRFNDGGQLGLGAEIGISTTKLHAYGPMGLKELTTSKYVVDSDYMIRK